MPEFSLFTWILVGVVSVWVLLAVVVLAVMIAPRPPRPVPPLRPTSSNRKAYRSGGRL